MDLRISELLASRICHDLVSGVGAINNGIELVSEFGINMSDDAFALIGLSAEQLSSRLQFFRLAYGEAGMRSLPTVSSVVAAAILLIGDREIKISANEPEQTLPEGYGKLFLNLASLALDALPRGGVIEVFVENSPENCRLRANIVADQVKLDDRIASGLNLALADESLNVTNVHACFSQRYARVLGGEIVVENNSDEQLTIFVELPPIP